MYEHGEPFEGFLVVDLSSSEEEDVFPYTSQDEEITQKLFGDLNHWLLGPPGDGRVIILGNSEEEEEMCKDDNANAKAMISSARNSPATSASTVEDDDTSSEVKMMVVAMGHSIGC
jgi:hypothetical protein